MTGQLCVRYKLTSMRYSEVGKPNSSGMTLVARPQPDHSYSLCINLMSFVASMGRGSVLSDKGQRVDRMGVFAGGRTAGLFSKGENALASFCSDRLLRHMIVGAHRAAQSSANVEIYPMLESARQNHQLVKLATFINLDEPTLLMDCSLRRWSVMEEGPRRIDSAPTKLQAFQQKPDGAYLQYYLSMAALRPTTPLIKVGLQYRELRLSGGV